MRPQFGRSRGWFLQCPGGQLPEPRLYRRGMNERVLVVVFGAQYTQLIALRVRESGVYCEIAPFDRAEEAHHRILFLTQLMFVRREPLPIRLTSPQGFASRVFQGSLDPRLTRAC